MKKNILALSLSLLTSVVFAQELIGITDNCGLDKNGNYTEVVSPENIIKDFKNPNLFHHHQIVFTKETKHYFLFFPYTTKTVLENAKTEGITGALSNYSVNTYTESVTVEKTDNSDESKSVLKTGTFKTGVSLIITKNPKSDTQCLIWNEQKLISLDDFTANDNTIQLPTLSIHSFTNHLTDSFESVWKDNDGNIYRVQYTGQKL